MAYGEVSISGYNASPPTDDGQQNAANEITWAKHKEKLSDPLKTAIESTQTAITTETDLLRLRTPTGGVIMWPTASAPSGWLLCDGAAVSRITYSDLFTLLGSVYGDGDSSTTFNLPNFEGRFVRGTDNGAGVDPDAASRTDRGDGTTGDAVGTLQAEDYLAHTHAVGTLATASAGDHAHTTPMGAISGGAATFAQGSGLISSLSTTTAGAHTHTITGATATAPASGGNETRPVNIGMNFIIKT